MGYLIQIILWTKLLNHGVGNDVGKKFTIS
jgi:hypothetical protein